MIPDRQACLALLAEAGCAQPVVDHVQAVAELALALADRTDEVDQAVIQAGALLHDIGRGVDHGPDHVPGGVAFLRDQGVDEVVVRCVARHMGAGITPSQAKSWGWPRADSYEPETLEEQIVAQADNLTIGTRHVPLARCIRRYRSQGLEEAIDRLQELEDELARRLGRAPSEIAQRMDQA